jgi:hypothetical protein
MHQLLSVHNPKASLLITVSPVPLFATFRMDTDVVTANTLSKCTLRTVAEYFAKEHDNVFYFPSFEFVLTGLSDPWEEDNRHVTKESIAQVMHLFEQLFTDS